MPTSCCWGARIAVFIDGCFWHSCPDHLHLPKANRDWWRAKLTSIVERDRDTDEHLRMHDWWPLRIWEHEHPARAADRILLLAAALTRARQEHR